MSTADDGQPDKAATVGEAISRISPAVAHRTALPRWPPDAFAVAMSVVRRSATYTRLVDAWPPRSQKNWTEMVSDLGRKWRECAMSDHLLPGTLAKWWKRIMEGQQTPLGDIRNNRRLREALLNLSATADEACSGVGLWDPNPEYEPSPFELECINLLSPEDGSPATLCREVHPSRAVVLPKLHAPRSGLTADSLTHHLAFVETSGVKVEWHRLPLAARPAQTLNLLLLPWPRRVNRHDFQPRTGELHNMPPTYGFFCYEPTRLPTQRLIDKVRQVLSRGERRIERIDAVILPELALDVGQAEKLAAAIGIMVVAGEGVASSAGGGLGINQAVVAVPVGASVVSSKQRKHHRWRLDASQIEQYGLDRQLDPRRQWWEHVRMADRRLQFWSASGWLNFCVLICEDLARPEPVSQVVRSVGPNLLISILMDGPQLPQRWGARYATVFADDPGCSVLTITSLGMARLSRPPGTEESRAISLWKDQGGQATPIELPVNHNGVALSLAADWVEEHTADGRSDGGTTAYLRLKDYFLI